MQWKYVVVAAILLAVAVTLAVALWPSKSGGDTPSGTASPSATPAATPASSPGAGPEPEPVSSRMEVRGPFKVVSERITPACGDGETGHCAAAANTYVTTVYELDRDVPLASGDHGASAWSKIRLAKPSDNEVRLHHVTVGGLEFMKGADGQGEYVTPDIKTVGGVKMDTVFDTTSKPSVYIRHWWDRLSPSEWTEGVNEGATYSRWTMKRLTGSHEFNLSDFQGADGPHNFELPGYNNVADTRNTGVADHYVDDDGVIPAPCRSLDDIAEQTCTGSTPGGTTDTGDLKCTATFLQLLFHRGFSGTVLDSFVDKYDSREAALADIAAKGYSVDAGGTLYLKKGMRVTVTWRYPTAVCKSAA